jgi:hypothetical protein
MDALRLPSPEDIVERIRCCREELAALRRLLRAARAAVQAEDARKRRESEPSSSWGGLTVTVETLDLDALVERIVARLAEHFGDERRLLNRSQLSARIGISERSVSDVVNRGELPPGYLIGGVRRWEWTAVLNHLGMKQGRQRRRGRGVYRRKGPGIPGHGIEGGK